MWQHWCTACATLCFRPRRTAGRLAAPPSLAPGVAITAPSEGTTVTGFVTVTAQVGGYAPIAGVQFTADGSQTTAGLGNGRGH
jgi:Bacterial Ig domain